jgi:hypothetical protein
MFSEVLVTKYQSTWHHFPRIILSKNVLISVMDLIILFFPAGRKWPGHKNYHSSHLMP